MRSVIRLGLGAALLLTAVNGVAHPFHESQAEIDYRSACRCLEITLRMKPEELEAALLRSGAPRLPLEHPRMQAPLQDYVLRHFAVSNDSQERVGLTWVGAEVDALGAWVYLQSAVVQLPVQLRNEVLLEEEPQQVNRVVVRIDGVRQGLSFSRDTERVQWIRAPDPAAGCVQPCRNSEPKK